MEEAIKWILGSGTTAAALVLLWKHILRPAWNVYRSQRALNDQITERREKLLHWTESGYDKLERQCAEQLIEIERLREELINAERAAGILREIQERDRITIRLLKQRCRESGIDYLDLEKKERKEK